MTSAVREDLGVANVALSLAAITCIAAFVRWEAGLLTSLVAVGALNYFHTTPIHSLRMTSGTDLLMIFLLTCIGIGSSAIAALRVRKSVRVLASEHSQTSLITLRKEISDTIPISQAWLSAINVLGSDLVSVEVRLADTTPSNLPVIARRNHNGPDSDDTFVLPESGAVVYFADPRIEQALVVTPKKSMGALEVNREHLFSFIQQIELALR